MFASNEPITQSGSRAHRVLQRQINQSVAEYEVLNILEQSWGGLCTHVREGWNIGKPCYGYKAKTYGHPDLTARREARGGSRDGSGTSGRPQARRTYLFRGMVFCGDDPKAVYLNHRAPADLQ